MSRGTSAKLSKYDGGSKLYVAIYQLTLHLEHTMFTHLVLWSVGNDLSWITACILPSLWSNQIAANDQCIHYLLDPILAILEIDSARWRPCLRRATAISQKLHQCGTYSVRQKFGLALNMK